MGIIMYTPDGFMSAANVSQCLVIQKGFFNICSVDGFRGTRPDLLPNLLLAFPIADVEIAFSVLLLLALYEYPIRFDFVVSAVDRLAILPAAAHLHVFPDRMSLQTRNRARREREQP